MAHQVQKGLDEPRILDQSTESKPAKMLAFLVNKNYGLDAVPSHCNRGATAVVEVFCAFC
jgi:hypothetical protein